MLLDKDGAQAFESLARKFQNKPATWRIPPSAKTMCEFHENS